MNALILIATVIAAIFISVFLFPEGAAATLICGAAALAVIGVTRLATQNDLKSRRFLLQIFILALLFRVGLAVFSNVYQLQATICPDALAFEETGAYLSSTWSGAEYYSNYLTEADIYFYSNVNTSGWGISYVAGVIYYLIGRNPLAVQMFVSVVGAATSLLVYACAKQLYFNERVSRIAAILVAFFPSLALWSSQILKDPFVIFFLAGSLVLVQKLLRKFSFLYLLLLFGCVAGIAAFRFYIIFALAPAILAGYLIDRKKSVYQVVARVVLLLVGGLVFSYFGFVNSVENRFGIGTQYSLERISVNRQWLATAAESGYGKDVDLSSFSGVMSALPQGFTYLMLAPFPWDVTNLRQAATIPEVIVWWLMVPLMVYGLWYTIRRLPREAMPILVFLVVLTFTYSISQGNVGTAYRQRAQLQVIYFVFVAVSIAIILEKRGDVRRAMRRNAMVIQNRYAAGPRALNSRS